MIVWGFCGSFCTLSRAIDAAGGFDDITAVVSRSVMTTDTRFGSAKENLSKIGKLCGGRIIDSVKDAEPIGPVLKPDAMIIAPCTGNTLAKIASGIADGAVTMAAKAHLRNGRSLVIALASNDALSGNFKNIATLCEKKNVFFVPMRQDDPIKKPTSLVADFGMIGKTLEDALHGRQTRPLFIT